MRAKPREILRRTFRAPLAESALGRLVDAVRWLNPDLRTNDTLVRELAARWPLDVNPELARQLDEIPSETSPRERRFLYRFFRSVWSGQGEVVEIGPFLGGTTRAIALGMQANGRREAQARLRTFDRFGDYYEVPALLRLLEPLFASGVLDRQEIEALGEAAPFLDVFERVHRAADYTPILEASNNFVPDRAEDAGADPRHLRLDADVVRDAVFIDGCKSWFGTKYFMQQVAASLRPGAWLLFQDYGWYTCFWLPAFVETFSESFDLECCVDTTYAFTLREPLTSEQIDAAFPDRPDGFSRGHFEALFDRAAAAAESRRDYFATTRLRLQLAGALATIGECDEARRRIVETRRSRWASGHRSVIEAALRSPTYTPDGEILL